MEKEEILLKEYEILMNHVLENWRIRYVLVGLNITALGTLASLAITRADAYLLLIIMSLVSSCLGIVWVGESLVVTTQINNVRDKISPALKELQINVPLITPIDYSWRTVLTKWKTVKSIFKGQSPGATTGIFIFFLPSFAGLLIAIDLAVKNGTLSWYFVLLIFISLILIYIFIAGCYAWYTVWTKKSEEPSNKEPPIDLPPL